MALANIVTVSLLMPGLLGSATLDNGRPAAPAGPGLERSPQIAVWTNRKDDVFERGDRMTVFMRTDVDAYVMIFRVNTDGQIRVLFPVRPFDDNYVRGGAALAVPGSRDGYTLRVQEYPGQGFLFALVTLDPIVLASFARGRSWDYQTLGIARHITGDPYVLFSDLLAALVPETYPDFAYAVTPYHVGERHAYPRFLCYQCHAYVSPAVWNPYAHSCIRVGVPTPLWWQYPFGAYGGTTVVGPPRSLPPGFAMPPRAPEASPRVPTRDRAAPATGTPSGRRPAPVPVALTPPGRRGSNPPLPTGRRPSAAPEGKSPAKGSPPTAAPRRVEAGSATARRPTPASKGTGRRGNR